MSSALREPVTEPSLVRVLRERALEHPERPAYAFLADGEVEEARLTFGELDRRARALGARLQQMGLAGERALLLYPPGLELVSAFLGCLYGGVVAVPAYPPRSPRMLPRLRAIAGDARPAVVLTTADALGQVEALAGRLPEMAGSRWLASGATRRLTPALSPSSNTPRARPRHPRASWSATATCCTTRR